MKAVVALGSNLGDRRGHLEWAVDQLRHLLRDVRVSSFYETAAVDVPDVQPPYLNAVVIGESDAPPEVLLRELLAIEERQGRQRLGVRAARTLDLDLILYGQEVRRGEPLWLPHPRYRERGFVLEPLAELDPELTDPVTGERVSDMLRRLEGD
jgi:2-amino-4-hydroxy-6-hydroxymethyldihydropteridine diphosphokinase